MCGVAPALGVAHRGGPLPAPGRGGLQFLRSRDYEPRISAAACCHSCPLLLHSVSVSLLLMSSLKPHLHVISLVSLPCNQSCVQGMLQY